MSESFLIEVAEKGPIKVSSREWVPFGPVLQYDLIHIDINVLLDYQFFYKYHKENDVSPYCAEVRVRFFGFHSGVGIPSGYLYLDMDASDTYCGAMNIPITSFAPDGNVFARGKFQLEARCGQGSETVFKDVYMSLSDEAK
jgi:hypothetical protein